MFTATIDRKALKKALTALRPFCKSKTRPILECVCLEVKRGHLLVTGTDLDTQLTFRLPARDHSPGVLLVEHKNLFQAVKMGSDDVVLDQTAEGLTVANDQSVVSLFLHSPDAYPKLKSRRARPYACQYNAIDFARLLAVSLPFAATDAGRYAMHGIRFKEPDSGASNVIMAVGTDGRRLGFGECKFEEPMVDVLPPLWPCTVPRYAIAALAKLLPKRLGPDPAPLRVWMPHENENQIVFAYDPFELIVRTIDGDFPRYQAVIPTSVTTSFTASTARLWQAVEIAKAGRPEGMDAVKLTLEGTTLVVSSSGASAPCVLDHVKDAMGASSVGLNADYLIDALKAVDTPTVEIGWSLDWSPVMFELGDGARSLLMPITIDG